MMKKSVVALIAGFAMTMCPCSSRAQDAADAIAFVPRPLEVKSETGKFEFKPDTAILVDKDSAEAMNAGKQLANRLRASTGMAFKISAADGGAAKRANTVRITSHGAEASLGEEGYRLNVAPDGVVITGDGPGMFYGMQTLLQLMPPEVFSPTKVEKPVAWTAPAVQITDKPRFRWRGLHLDVSRHFFSKPEIENFLDLMAQHKLNTFHWHLTDDVGWRLDIKRYPKLTEVAAWRKHIGYGLNPKDGTAYDKDGRYGGFFTQDDVREIVAYAKARHITIVPEIDIPGHSGAALSAYPEFSCFGDPIDRDTGAMGVFCPGNEDTFAFLENVFAEVMDLFPDKYIHVGGDEVDKSDWAKCPKCQQRMKGEGLKDVNELQSYFIKRIEKFLNQHHRTMIGWDEILEGGLAPNAVVMSWRGVEGGIVAANAGHDVVMTPGTHCYLDHYQAKEGEPKAIGGYSPLQHVYNYEPIPPGISAEKTKHVLGAGGNLWSEFFPNYAHVQYMAYPRACALAEVTWSDPNRKNWDDFKRRMEIHFERLKAEKVNYRAPRETDPGY
ncbi:MAG: beta-N-acetylhexosaminidase [Pirellulales bacterium]|nr:beta-N-acetylhexosaminidase [Pirellulales bacterium]